MKIQKIFPGIVFIVLATICIQACSKTDPNDNPPVAAILSDTVTIQADGFSPATITIAKGTKLTWKNIDTQTHSVSSDDGTSFNSGNISANGMYSFTFTSNGSLPYRCSLHPGETGIVQVVTR
ncbi:MAG TPA: cupredoxin domain-containing protein [Ferruginibacter sp.]|nr:cupredoxin domain-containing protein [Ferruginibacter sp.]